MTLFIGGPAHGRDIETGDPNYFEWPIPPASRGLVPYGGIQPLRRLGYNRKRFGLVSEDGSVGWTRDVYVADGISDGESRRRLMELLLDRFIRDGVQVVRT